MALDKNENPMTTSFNFDLFNQSIDIIAVDDKYVKRETVKYLNKHKGKDKWDADSLIGIEECDAFVLEQNTTGSGNILMVFGLPTRYDIIVHECVHVASELLIERHMKIDSQSSEETWAYTIQTLFRKVVDSLPKNKIHGWTKTK